MKLERRGRARPVLAPGRSSASDPDDELRLVVQALEAIPVGVVVQDAGGRIVAANARGRVPLDDLAGNALAIEALRKAVATARASGTVTETLRLHGAQVRTLEITASPLAGGAVVAVLADTTERERLDSVRRDFVANVNHELRTPIGALSVLSDALAAERDPATVDRLAGRIGAEAERARLLIEELLDFSRVETNQQPRSEPIVVSSVLDEAVRRVSAAAEAAAVEVRVDSVGTANVHGDREQLVTALANLIDNAIKYSDGGSTVRISATATDGQLSLIVKDEGIGIPARDVQRIFERFYRVDAARDRRTGGTGLGLAIVRHVAANHGGSVDVASEEGAGSTFTLRVPLGGRPT